MPVPDPTATLRELALTILLTGARLNALESDRLPDRIGRLVPLPLRDPCRN
jgi:hypothetical protein